VNDEVIITMQDVRAARMCAGGARRFFAKHDMDWNDFLKNGISSTKLDSLDDHMVQQILKEARRGRK